MVRLRAKRGFYDRKAERYRPTGEVFDVTEARAAEILAAGVAEIMEVLAAPADDPTKGAEEPAAAGTDPRDPPKQKRKKG